MNKLLNKLYEEYPWLKVQTTVEEYINPQYYNRIIKEYVFNGKDDLQLFMEWISPLLKKREPRILELGCGSGRVTNEICIKFPNNWSEFSLLDLSKQMLTYTGERFSKYEKIKLINSDSVQFLKNTNQIYDIVYSLWSFSHSVHQILTRDGLESGKEYVQSTMRKFVSQNMSSNSELFLIHFDSMSDEQKILLKQWTKVFPLFGDLNSQSLSKQLIDEVLINLQNEELIEYNANHYIGKEIEYSSENEALEVFMNFHLESFFNESDLLTDVIEDLKSYFKQFTDDFGKVKIKPGCFIYKVRKL